jgi:hypothetical protein
MSFWSKGAGLATALLQRVLHNKRFQASLTAGLETIGQKIKDNISNPDNLVRIAENLIQGSKAVAGTIVKGTEAEKLVSPEVVEAGKVIEENGKPPNPQSGGGS